VRSLLTFAESVGYLEFNFGKHLRSIRQSKTKEKQSSSPTQRILSPEQVATIYNGATKERDRAMIKTAYLLGLRIDELLNLHTQDFYRDASGGYKVKVVGKGAKERHIHVPQELFYELNQLHTEGYLFRSNRGKPMSTVAAHKILKKILSKTGVDSSVSWHWFRHSCASHSMKNGASLESIRKKLGHSSIAVTSVYLHDDDDPSKYISL
jgi:integrase/recombinase XerD